MAMCHNPFSGGTMPSTEELIELNKQGDLGEMLAEKFRGERGALRGRKDAELMIGFASRSETPTAEMIATAVVEHYTRLGYIVRPHDGVAGSDCFEAEIFYSALDGGCVHVVITTFYPLTIGRDDEHNHLRISTTV